MFILLPFMKNVFIPSKAYEFMVEESLEMTQLDIKQLAKVTNQPGQNFTVNVVKNSILYNIIVKKEVTTFRDQGDYCI